MQSFNHKRIKSQLALATATSAVLAAAMSNTALAASSTWSASPADTNWGNVANWTTGVPGLINPAAGGLSTDVATFNSPIFNGIGDASNPILNENQRQVRSILFDAGVGPYVIGVNGGNQLWLGHSGNVTMNAGVTAAQVIAAPTQIRLPSSTNGTYSIVNNATDPLATLSFTGGLLSGSASTRPLTITLDGTNTGSNTINSLSDQGTAGALALVKNGAGTWVISGASTWTQQTDVGVNSSVIVNAGTLAAQNAASFGSLTQGNIRATGTGTLRLDGIALQNNGVTLDLTGRLLANGTSSVNAVPVAATATDVTLGTTNATDVFTINGVVSGGAASSVLHVAGPGQVLLNNANSFTGTWSLDSGTTTLGNATALGPVGTAGLAFGAGSTAKLQLNGNSTTVTRLNTNAAAGTPVIENGGGAPATLTLNTAVANTYAGTLQDGAGGGSLALTKSGTGSLTLSLTGANTYSGGTAINTGTLLANNTTGSATGTGPVSIASTATLGGGGTAGGAVTVSSGGTIAPGAADNAIGTLNVGSLTLASGSKLDYDVASTSSLDQIIVGNSGGLQIDGGELSINDAAAPFTVNGVYNLIGYGGAIGGAGVGALTLNPSNQQLATNSYTFGEAGGFVTLTVASSGGTISYWNANADGNWSTGPWTTPTPNAPGAFAAFGGGGTEITAPRTITVDGPFTVGTLSFNNPNFGYTLAPGAGGAITLDNNAATSFVTNSAGNHAVQVPLAMTASGATFSVVNAADTLTASGAVSGPSALTKGGAGTLALTGANTYTGGTNLNAGAVAINSDASLGDAAGGVTFGGGGLKLLADVASARNYQLNGLSNAVVDTNGQTLTHAGTIAPQSGATGGVVKNGAGTLVLQGTNSYVGQTTVNAGTLSISSNANLGDPATGAGVNLGAGSTLAATATTSLDNAGANARPVNVAAGGAGVDVADAATLTVPGVITGGTVTKTGPGTLAVSNTANTASYDVTGGTLNAQGTMGAGNGGIAGSATVTLRDGTTLSGTGFGNNNSWTFGSLLNVPTGATATLNTPNRFNWTGTASGGGTLNVNVNTNASRFDFNGNLSGFTGRMNVTGTGTARFFFNGGSFNGNSLQSTHLDLGGSVATQGVTNSGGNTLNIGALSGSSTTATLGGGTAGSPRYSIGALGTDTTFDGLVTGNAAIVKVGGGSLTLSGANNHTGGTTVNAGTLNVTTSLGAATAPLVVSNTNTGAGPSVATLNLPAGSPTTTGSLSGTITTPGGAHTAVINNNGQPLTVDQTTAGTYQGSIAGAGSFTLGFGSTAALTLAGPNTYTGGTTVHTGTLVAAHEDALPADQALTIDNGATARGTAGLPKALDIRGLTVTASGPTGGTLDITDGALVVRHADQGTAFAGHTTVNNLVRNAFNEFAWNQPGITSTTVAADVAAGVPAALGILLNNDGSGAALFYGNGTDLPQFEGRSVDGNSVLTKTTLLGDGDLNGTVDSVDFALFQAGYTGAAPYVGFAFGDYDYNGVIDSVDFGLFQAGYQYSQSNPTPEMVAFADEHHLSLVAAAVPEPTTLGVLAMGAIGILGRRRRRNG